MGAYPADIAPDDGDGISGYAPENSSMSTGFILWRLLQALLALILMSFLVYVLMGLMPGDPIDMMMAGNPHMTPEDAARLKALYGLDRPLLERYARWALTL